jgi:Dolichyl-phosphate-mannose-protein mannosyltransferase
MRRAAPILVLLAVAATVVAIAVVSSDRPHGSDALFYEAQVEELQGASQEEGLDEWFTGPEARVAARTEDDPEDVVRVLDPAWVEYSDQFYRRRWVVPLMAAGVDPVVGEERLRVVSLAGYLLIGPLLFLLLRRRFPVRTSLAVSLACILLPPVIEHGTGRGVDSWGVVLELAAFLFLVLAVDSRSLRWLPAWALAMAALSFTRDNTLVLLVAIGWLLWVQRREPEARRRNAALAGSGLAVSLPAPLLFGSPLRDQLAYVTDDFAIPQDTSWGYILSHYPEQVARVGYYNLRYVTEHAFTPLVTPLLVVMVIALIGSLLWLILRSPKEDSYFRMMRAGAFGGLALLAIAANYQSYRLELVWLPAVAVGAALVLEWALRRREEPVGEDLQRVGSGAAARGV